MRLRRAPSRGGRVDAATSPPEVEPDVIDLRHITTPRSRLDLDPAHVAEMAERMRERREKAEAQRDLIRLRARHWSGERLIEEGCRPLEWWEHPDADPYAVLGLLPGASLASASSARRRVAQRCHPDRLTADADADEALRRMVAANSAYDRLRRALRPD